MTEQNAVNESTLTPQLMGAAASRLVGASIGDIATVFSRSPAQKHYTFADMEWMVLPPVYMGQFYVAEMVHAESGLHAPIAAATWAFVSAEVDQRIRANPASRIRLRPDEWTSGGIGWIVDLAGPPNGVMAAVDWMLAGPFKDREASLIVFDARGQTRIESLKTFAAAAHGSPP